MKRFQSFRLDTGNQCLWNGEARVNLAPKAFDVLRYLVEHAGRLVTPDELLEALWPGTYVNPEGLRRYIQEIRKELGDRPDKPVFIETLPKRGYQFVAPVIEESSAKQFDLLPTGTAKNIVGRESAFAELARALNEALRGRRQIVFVTGEPGIGKTTLVDEFQRRAASNVQAVRIVRGQCMEGYGGQEAYYPMLEALGQLCHGAGGDWVVQTLAQQAPTWLVQFPALLKPEHRDMLQREILGTTRERMLREISEALETITSENPLILVFDDLHWADHSTVDLLSALARRRTPAKMMLIGNYYPVEVILSEHPLKALKQDLLVHQLCREVALEPLEESDVAQYLAAGSLEASLPEGLARLVYQHSQGNPLFMIAVLEHMTERGFITCENGRCQAHAALEEIDLAIPETMRQMIRIQSHRHSVEEQQVLRAGSIAAGPPDVAPAAAQATMRPLSQPDGVEERHARNAVEQADPWHSRASRRGLLTALVCVVLGLGVVGALSSGTWKRWFPAPQIRSLVVLPLENLSGDPKQEYFADGMTEELIADLGQVSALRVISRTSAMTYKGTKKRLPEIAHELGVDAAVEGSAVREGNQVRITAQLIDARTDRHLWARTYVRDLTSVLTLQGEVAQEIADAVRIEVTPQEKTRLARARLVNPEAQDLYLRGMLFLNTGHPESAIDYFQKALDKDPNYAQAHAALADSYGIMGEYGWISYSEAFSKQRTEAIRAIELDDALPEGHVELANAAMNLDWDWVTPAKEFQRALELNPNSAPSHWRYAVYLERTGRLPEAIAEVRRGMELDPVSSRSYSTAGATYYFARQYDQSLAENRRASPSDDNLSEFVFHFGTIYVEKGMYAEAIREFQKLGDRPHALGHLANAYARAGQVDAALETISQVEKHVQKEGVGRYEIALAYAGLGKKDEAFRWLEEAYKAHDEGLTNLKIDPCLDPLRSDPRFADLVRRVGLPP